MTKNELKMHIKNHWKYQLLAIFLAFLVSILCITIASTPTRKEKISIFVVCNGVSGEYSPYIDSLKPDYLEVMEAVTIDKKDTYYTTILNARMKRSDIVVVPESSKDMLMKDYYFVLSDEFIDNFTTTDYEYFDISDTHYGIKVYSKDTHTGILNGLVDFKDEEEEDYYLFINKTSYHMGEFNNSKYDGLINVLKEILNYEQEI